MCADFSCTNEGLRCFFVYAYLTPSSPDAVVGAHLSTEASHAVFVDGIPLYTAIV
jgi:hypothetical protein